MPASESAPDPRLDTLLKSQGEISGRFQQTLEAQAQLQKALGERLDALEPFDPSRMAGRILQQGDVVGLGQVVILGGQPENRHGAHTLFAQGPRHAHGGQRFVQREDGAGQQADLLPRNHGNRTRLSEKPDVVKRRLAASEGLILPGQNRRQSAPSVGGDRDLAGHGLKAGGFEGRAAVKMRDTVEVIEVVREQRARLGHASIRDAGTAHRGFILHCPRNPHNVGHPIGCRPAAKVTRDLDVEARGKFHSARPSRASRNADWITRRAAGFTGRSGGRGLPPA